MNEVARVAGPALLDFLKSAEGRKTGMTALKKGGEFLGKVGAKGARLAEDAVLAGAPAAASFAEKYVGKKGMIGDIATRVATAPTDEVIDTAILAGKIAKPLAQTVALAGTGALVGGALTKPETAYSTAMDTIAAREASAYGIIDAKLQADAARQLGNQELAAQKFQQALYLQEQRQQHDAMMAQARAQARTPMNQPMSGSDLFDGLMGKGGLFGGANQY